MLLSSYCFLCECERCATRRDDKFLQGYIQRPTTLSPGVSRWSFVYSTTMNFDWSTYLLEK